MGLKDLGETIIVRVIAVILAFICSGYFFFISVQLYDNSQQSPKWPSVNGVILKSEVVYDAGSLIAERDTFKYNVQYEYTIGELKYTGNRVTFNPYDARTVNTERLYAFQDRYPVGAIVNVYYNRANLTDSVLEPGFSSKPNVFLYIGVALCVIGLFFLVNILTGFGESLLQFCEI